MKRFAFATLAAITLAGPLAATAAYADPPRHDNRGDYRDNDRRDGNWRDNDRRDHNRRADRWDDRRYNGYTYNGRWHYGPPPSAYDGRYQPGFRQWRRGERLPAYYRSHYRQVDYRRERLRAPPRGYHYVRDDRGDVLLVAIATGVIASILLSQ